MTTTDSWRRVQFLEPPAQPETDDEGEQ